MENFLILAQAITSVLLIVAILLQQRGGSLGAAFGGGGEFYVSQRGIQKKIFVATCILGTLFIVFSLLNLIL